MSEDMKEDLGVPPSGSGYSAKPEPSCTVSAVPVSIPNAEDIMRFLRWKRDMFRDATIKCKQFRVRPSIDHVVHELVLDELITEIERGEHHALRAERAVA